MKMKKAALIAGILGAVIIGSSITITQQNEYKLIRQFGKVDRVICEPGISFKIPLIERTQSLPKETLLYDLEASDVITKDKKTMISDSYVLWRITDPLKFAQTLNSSLENSESRINTAVYNATKNVITGTTASASLEPLCIFIPRSADPTNAAGAASTPKMNCGDVENNANKMIGNTDPYRP